MRYDHPELKEELAARYALGGLRGPARRRLERLAQGDPFLAQRVSFWEAQLNGLIEAVPPVEPPARVWTMIERSLGFGGQAGAGVTVLAEAAARRLRRRVAQWRAVGVSALAVAAALAIYIGVTQRSLEPGEAAVAILSDESGRPAFVATADHGGRRLNVTRLAESRPAIGRAYELWLLPKGGKPRPIGILPDMQRAAFAIPAPDAVAGADGVAISLEPMGGSPTGLPTGPILFKGAIIGR